MRFHQGWDEFFTGHPIFLGGNPQGNKQKWTVLKLCGKAERLWKLKLRIVKKIEEDEQNEDGQIVIDITRAEEIQRQRESANPTAADTGCQSQVA